MSKNMTRPEQNLKYPNDTVKVLREKENLDDENSLSISSTQLSDEESQIEGKISDVEELSYEEEEDDDDNDDDDDDDDGSDTKEEDDEETEEDSIKDEYSTESDEDESEMSNQTLIKTEAVLKPEDESTSEEITNTSTPDSDLEDSDKEVEHHIKRECQRFLVLQDYNNDKNEFLSLKKGEIITVLDKTSEYWWTAENFSSQKGLVPSTILKLMEDTIHLSGKASSSMQEQRRGSHLWRNFKKLLHQQKFLPKNVQNSSHPKWLPSTLYQIKEMDDRYSLECAIMPKLKKSGLGFQEVFIEKEGNPVLIPTACIQKIIYLLNCQNILIHESVDFAILHRHLYICLFDGSNILSNIHSVHAKWEQKSPKTWNFFKNISLSASCADEGKFFIKSDYTSTHIGILFEVCASIKNVQTNENGIITCGWSFLKLYDEVGHPIKNGTFTLPINKGSFYELKNHSLTNLSQDVEEKSSLFTQNRLPRLVVKLMQSEDIKKISFQCLPHSLIGSASLLPFFILFRHIVSDLLLLKTSSHSAEVDHFPSLSIFARCCEIPDLMDVLRADWSEALKQYQRSEKKKTELLKRIFASVIMRSLNSLCCINLPEYSLINPQSILIRKQFLDHLYEIKNSKGHLAMMLSPNFQYNSFDIQDVGFNVMGRHSLHIYDSAFP